MRYVTYAPDGTLTGCYLQDLVPEHISHFIPVSEAIAAVWVNYRATTDRASVELKEV